MRGDFNLADADLNLSNLHFDIPGASIKLAGIYSLDGAKFNFTGTAEMQATVSRMVGGWKGLLLMSVDQYFQKNGAGTEVRSRSMEQGQTPISVWISIALKRNELNWPVRKIAIHLEYLPALS